MTEGYNPFALNGKTILITGASSGIGRQCAIDISNSGANVILVGRNLDRLNDTATKLNGSSVIKQIDLDRIDLISQDIQTVIDETGPIDGFVHCAGIEKTLPLKLTTPQLFEELYRVNLLSAIEIIKVLTRKKNYNSDFKIVLISSITALIARNGTAPYTASKGAMIALCREMALEFAKKKININCISPGTILTPLMESVLEQMDTEARTKRINEFPLGLGIPSDISLCCVYLLSEAARWITGQNFVIDGGRTIL